MTLEILSPTRIKSPTNPNVKVSEVSSKNLKQARERLDRVAEQERFGWKEVQKLAVKKFGHCAGLSISECKSLIEEIKKK